MRWQCPNDIQVVLRVGVIGKEPQENNQYTNQAHDKEKHKIKGF